MIAGEHDLVIYATDRAGNTGFSRVLETIHRWKCKVKDIIYDKYYEIE